MRRHPHFISFKHAWEGIAYAFTSQPNFIVHLLFAIAVLFAGCYFHITQTETVILLFSISLVIIAELLNTAIESVTDILVIEYSKNAKIAKDVAAGMVLFSAFSAVIVGAIIFLPYIVLFF
jgi:diacylglycerol kinase